MSTNGETVPETIALGPKEEAPGRPFTAVDLIERDVGILLELLADVRGVLREIDAGIRMIEPYQRLAWRVDGLTHRLIICDEPKLRFRDRTCAVGFFGERTKGIDPGPLEEANTAIVAEFDDYPGILSYSSVELAGGRWANLVLHDDPVDREYWRQSELHAEAVRDLSPVHYRNVRIHNAELTDALTDSPNFVLERTKYYDFEGGSEWRAQRELVPA
jgi:hypothetical protein